MVKDLLIEILKAITILPRRIRIETPGMQAGIPLLRSVWGAALHDFAPQAYIEVFEGEGAPHERTPQFILRPAPADPSFAPAFEFILIGLGIEHDVALLRAWDIASGMGLGPDRRRFFIREVVPLSRKGGVARSGKPWALGAACLPTGMRPKTPCTLFSRSPLRLIRNRLLTESPTVEDLVVGMCRRLLSFLPQNLKEQLVAIRPQLQELASTLPADLWGGARLDFHRYSAAQQSAVDLRGVTGEIRLPAGLGELWPLFVAAQWIHLGKGTVFGLGQIELLR